MEQVKEKHDYQALKKMLVSEDVENQVMGLECLEHIPFEENMITILLLVKHVNIDTKLWRKHAPNIVTRIQSEVIDINKILTYQDILNIMKKYKASPDQIALFVEDVNETLRQSLVEYGYDFIDKITITLKENTDD